MHEDPELVVPHELVSIVTQTVGHPEREGFHKVKIHMIDLVSVTP